MNDTETPASPTGNHRWPVLRAAQDIACDGRNPRTDEPCLLGNHRGFHRDETGAEWLDD